MRKLAASNRRAQIGTFKDLLSNSPTSDDSHNNLLLHPTGIIPSSHPNLLPSTTLVAAALLARQMGLQAKKAVSETLAQKLGCTSKEKAKTSKRKRTSTPPPSSMELIRPGSKRRVRVTRIAAESTPSRRMRKLKKDINEDANKDADEDVDIDDE